MSLDGAWERRFGGWQAARRRSGSIIESTAIDMKEAQVRTPQQVRQVLAGTQAVEFQAAADDEDRYAWIESVLRRQRDVLGDERFVRLGSISVADLYHLRRDALYRNQRVVLTKTQPSKYTQIGVRKAPAPEAAAACPHRQRAAQGDLDGVKALSAPCRASASTAHRR